MNQGDRVSYFLEPGFIYFSKAPAVVRTVVGSCVAVCLWDKKRQFGGINHYLRPWTKDPQQATPQYGNVATAALIQILEDAGSEKEDIIAQITGGAHPEGASPEVGDANVRIAREILERKSITIVSEDTGGTLGRKLVFDTFTGQLAVLKVHKVRSTDWMSE